jgi:hypothetical protein
MIDDTPSQIFLFKITKKFKLNHLIENKYLEETNIIKLDIKTLGNFHEELV